jgi:hypothetical protein
MARIPGRQTTFTNASSFDSDRLQLAEDRSHDALERVEPPISVHGVMPPEPSRQRNSFVWLFISAGCRRKMSIIANYNYYLAPRAII